MRPHRDAQNKSSAAPRVQQSIPKGEETSVPIPQCKRKPGPNPAHDPAPTLLSCSSMNTISPQTSDGKSSDPDLSPALPHPHQGEAAAMGPPSALPTAGSLPWGRVCRGTEPCPGGRLTSPWRCRFSRCCCWSCCICRSCCWKASCLFPNGCRETKARNQSLLFPALQQEPRRGWQQ